MKKLVIVSLLVLIVLTACGDLEVNKDEGKPIVYTSFYPLYFIGQELNQDTIDLKTIIPNGVDPHDYEPSLRQIRDLNDGMAFIYIHENFESWANRIVDSLDEDSIILRAGDYVDLLQIDQDHHEEDDHHHDHGDIDYHIWLDPDNMIKIADQVKEVFIAIDPANERAYQDNYNILLGKLEDLDKKFTEDLKDKERDHILVSHAAFSYMANKYDFKQTAVAGISPDQEPSPRTIANIIDTAKEEDIKYIFLETIASPKTVSVIADEADLDILTLNPIEGLTKEDIDNNEDYISIMYKNLENLVKALVE